MATRVARSALGIVGLLSAAALASWACSGKTTGGGVAVDGGPATTDAAPKGSSSSDAGGGAIDAGPAPCVYVTGSGSSGSSGACEYSETYACGAEERSIACRCPDATCTCGADSFAFDCGGGCVPGTAERARCGVPDEPDGGGSGSSSSSGGG